jgi:hypothetical protein
MFEPWRQKLCSLLQVDGIEVKHFKTGESIRISHRIMTFIILMTIIDIADQFIDYQDKLYDNKNGHMEFNCDNWGCFIARNYEAWPMDECGLNDGSVVHPHHERRRENQIRSGCTLDCDEEIELVILPVFTTAPRCWIPWNK